MKKTRKKYKNYSKKHKNKTLKGGSLSPLIIGLAGTGGVAASALSGWFLLGRRQKSLTNINNQQDVSTLKSKQMLCDKDGEVAFIKQIKGFLSNNKKFNGTIKQINTFFSNLDKNPSIGSYFVIDYSLYTKELFKMHNKAYKILKQDSEEAVYRSQDKRKTQLVYFDYNYYYCIINELVIQENSLYNLVDEHVQLNVWWTEEEKKLTDGWLQFLPPVLKGGVDLGRIYQENLDRQREESIYSEIDSERQRSINKEEQEEILEKLFLETDNSQKFAKFKELNKQITGNKYKLFCYFNHLLSQSEEIKKFYRENVPLLQPEDLDLIKSYFYISSKGTKTKKYIKKYGTNSRKKIELLNLISEHVICKYLIQQLDDKLFSSEEISLQTQSAIKKSIVMNWRINNIYEYPDSENLPEKHKLYTKKFVSYNDGKTYERLVKPEFVGGSWEEPTSLLTNIDNSNNIDLLNFLNTVKNIPYEVLLYLVKFILSTNGDSIKKKNSLVVVAFNIIYNEITRYSRQKLYDTPYKSQNAHRIEAGCWNRVIYAIPRKVFNMGVKSKELLVVPLNMNQTNMLVKQLVKSISKLKGEMIKHLMFIQKTCSKIGIQGNSINVLLKKRIYIFYYLILHGLDEQWVETLNSFNEKYLDLLLSFRLSNNKSFEQIAEQLDYTIIDLFKKIGFLDDPGSPTSGLLLKIIHNRTWNNVIKSKALDEI